MINDAITALYFLLPAIFANGAPVIIARLPLLGNFSYPLDGRLKLGNKRILGDHKTIRGVITAISTSFFVISLETHFLGPWYFNRFALFDYGEASNLLLYGFLFGAGAMLGDILGSFLKRRMGIQSGTWLPYIDQADWVVGVLILLALFSLLPTLEIIIISLTLVPFLTLTGSFISTKLKIKSSI